MAVCLLSRWEDALLITCLWKQDTFRTMNSIFQAFLNVWTGYENLPTTFSTLQTPQACFRVAWMTVFQFDSKSRRKTSILHHSNTEKDFYLFLSPMSSFYARRACARCTFIGLSLEDSGWELRYWIAGDETHNRS